MGPFFFPQYFVHNSLTLTHNRHRVNQKFSRQMPNERSILGVRLQIANNRERKRAFNKHEQISMNNPKQDNTTG